MPAAQVPPRAACDRRQTCGLTAARRRRLDDVERSPEQVCGDDARRAGADVDAERQERLVVHLDRHAGLGGYFGARFLRNSISSP